MSIDGFWCSNIGGSGRVSAFLLSNKKTENNAVRGAFKKKDKSSYNLVSNLQHQNLGSL